MAARTTSSSYRRRFKWFAAAITAVIALYTGGWYYVAGIIDSEASKAIASANLNGVRLDCENSEVRGYPFRLGLNCQTVNLKHSVADISFSAGAFRSAAQVYNPAFLVSELDGTALLEVPGLLPLVFDWQVLRSSVRLATPLPTRISVEGREIAAAFADPARKIDLLRAETLEMHLRPNGPAVEMAASVVRLAVNQALLEGRQIPAVDGGIDLAIDDGVRWATSARQSLRGQTGSLRQSYLALDADSSIRAKGTFGVDYDGLLDADLTVTVRGVVKLAKAAAEAFPESVSEIENFAASLKALGENAELPLRVSKGRITYGFFDLGTVPPLP